ncbi:hypothetical protein ACHAXS_012389 [Conticribra weissflogii]
MRRQPRFHSAGSLDLPGTKPADLSASSPAATATCAAISIVSAKPSDAASSRHQKLLRHHLRMEVLPKFQ